MSTGSNRPETPGTDSETSPVVSPLAPFLDGATKRSRFSVRPRPVVELPHVDGLLAGAAEVDITPPPGLPKAGYSANAHDGTGFRTRLRARVTHLRAGRSSLAIIQLDLLGGSSVVQHLVAQAVADRTDIPLAGIWIGATHTHAGPGQFLGTDFYNHNASNRAGFDPAWTQFLVDRIAQAVIEAHDTRAPARAAVGSTEVWGLTRNRSHEPHVQNRTVTDKRLDPQRKWVSVNPLLHLIRVDRITTDGTEPLAAPLVFSIHGTGINQHAHEYHADVWAYLVGELGHLIKERHGARPVVGAMEGTHADVAPALRPGMAGHREASRIGRAIGAEAADLYDRLGSELTEEVALDAGLREVDLDVAQNRRIGGVEIPDRPAVGAALVAGATENLTPVINRIPPFKAGFPKRWGTDNPQGVKWVIGSRWLQPLVLPKPGFPRVIPVQTLRVADTVLVGLPFEVTVESGRRIEAEVMAAVPDRGVERVVVSSVVNEYCGYVATAEEYTRQFYEGGHTLYGPNTQEFLAAQAARLAAATVGAGLFADVIAERRWSLSTKRYLPVPAADHDHDHDHPHDEHDHEHDHDDHDHDDHHHSEGPVRGFGRRATFTDPTDRTDGFWEQSWNDAGPGDLSWHEPLVRVEASDDDGETWAEATDHGRAIDDQGWSLELTHVGVGEGQGHRYRVRWYDPVHRFGRRHRFVLLAGKGGPEVRGEAFD